MTRPASASTQDPAAEIPEVISVATLSILSTIAVCLAVAFRLPFLSESLWVDELHSAWTIWGELGDVSRRAALGNQTPVYYWGLWFWRQLVGDGEVALRMSSVILSSLACGVVAAGVARHSRSLVGGLAAGGILAIEPNAIFFGTELRVFAAVMLLAAISLWSWVEQQRTGAGQAAAILFFAVILAAIIQPMSLGVLGWLCISRTNITRVGGWLRRPPPGQRPAVAVLLAVLIIAVGLLLFWWLVGGVMTTAWRHRGQWAAFASAHSPWQIWTMWRWNVLLLIPAGLATAFAIADRLRGRSSCWCPAGGWLQPALLAVWVTTFFWLLSASGIVAVFHRRYLIAMLPILVWSGASAIGEVCCRLRHEVWIRRRLVDETPRQAHPSLRFTQPLMLLILCVLAVLVVLRWKDGPGRLRGEDWRAAVAAVATRADNDAPILLSPGLIETRRLLASGDPAQIAYLAFPLSGPYPLSPVLVIELADDPASTRELVLEHATRFALLRCSQQSAQRWAKRVAAAGDSSVPISFSVHSFGGVQVVRFVVQGLTQRSQ